MLYSFIDRPDQSFTKHSKKRWAGESMFIACAILISLFHYKMIVLYNSFHLCRVAQILSDKFHGRNIPNL